jgi:hypothetical protein
MVMVDVVELCKPHAHTGRVFIEVAYDPKSAEIGDFSNVLVFLLFLREVDLSFEAVQVLRASLYGVEVPSFGQDVSKECFVALGELLVGPSNSLVARS